MMDCDAVWISDLNQLRFLQFSFSTFSLFQFWLKRYIKHSTQCLTTFPNTLKFVKNTPLRVLFSTLFSVFEKVIKHGRPCLTYYNKCKWIIWACFHNKSSNWILKATISATICCETWTSSAGSCQQPQRKLFCFNNTMTSEWRREIQ